MAEDTTTDPVYVMPKREVLSSHGYIWEGLLAGHGWNELPPEKKIGRIVRSGLIDGKYKVCNVFFPGCNHTAKTVFLGEIRPLTKEERLLITSSIEVNQD